jgi:hypothetical protein
MMRRSAVRQRGAALLVMVMILGLGATWYLVSRLNDNSAALAAARKARNAEILERAKQTLIGYIAAQASFAGENRPGAFPCPEAPGYFDSTTQDGQTAASCTLPAVGRFPWRTLGTDKLVDANGEPLWYVVASGWASANTVINSDCASASSGMACATGRLSVDGVTNDVIALIIAPGPAITVSASANCAAWPQVRPTTGTPDLRNYLECQNGTSPADNTFTTTGPSGSFNDQLVTITVGDLLPALEASIASRIEREIAPALATVYTPAGWGFSGSNAIYPYPAAFANPGPGAGTSSYQGMAGNYNGLLPLNQTQGCTESATDLRCTTVTTGTSATTGLAALMEFSKFGSDVKTAGAGSIRTQSMCSWQSDVYVCTGEYLESSDESESIAVTVSVSVTNVAMGLRKFDSSKITCTAVDDVGAGSGQQNVTCTSTVALQADGSARITVATSTLPIINAMGWGTYATYSIRIQRAAIGDHALLDTADATTGWFARNEWFRLVYYAVAPSNTAARLPLERSCSTAGDCLTVSNVTPTSRRAVLVLAGRALNGASRPSSALADYLEFGNALAAYERRTVTPKPPSLLTDTGTANAYAVALAPLATGASFQFKAASANTGASTLNTAATGTRDLVNVDGSPLAAGTIQANAAAQVTWDGTNFVLSKRPFNDRVIPISSN